jgi:pimeloyl-ACP methyl ester carboxylesterase
MEIAYDVEGTGPDLLLIAGVASTRALWTLVRPRLSQHFRTIAFDHRDCGDSSPAGGSYGLADLAGDARAVLDAANSSRAHILGHSMGGAVAQAFADIYAARTASLTLACSWAHGDGYTKNLFGLLCDLTDAVTDDRTLLETIIFLGAGITTLRETSLAETTAQAMALGGLIPRAALKRQWQLSFDVEMLATIAKLRVPTHVIWGSEDRLLPPPLSQTLLSSIPGAVETRIDKCGHVPMFAAPDTFVDAVTSFLLKQPT